MNQTLLLNGFHCFDAAAKNHFLPDVKVLKFADPLNATTCGSEIRMVGSSAKNSSGNLAIGLQLQDLFQVESKKILGFAANLSSFNLVFCNL